MPSTPTIPVTRDGALVGVLRVTGTDNYWVRGEFVPGPAYAACAPLFEHERQLRAIDDDGDGASDAWFDAVDAINALDLRVDGTRVRDFKIDVDARCEFKFDR